MKDDNNLASVWKQLSHKIISSILVDHGAIIPVRDILGDTPFLFPPKEGIIWRLAIDCVEHDTAPTPEAIITRLNGDSPIEYGWVQTLANQWNDDDNRKVIYHAEELRRIGMLARYRAIGRDMSQQTSTDELRDLIEKTESELSKISAIQSGREATAAAIDGAAWAEIANFQVNNIPSGLDWFDNLGGGFWPGMNYWITAAYKSGKTTVLRNIVKTACEHNIPCAVFCAEGTRELFALSCQAMIATELLVQRGWDYRKPRISGIFIMRWWQNQTGLMTAEIDAINEARTIWKRWPIHIYDSRDGIRNRATMRFIIKRDKMEYGLKLAGLDYSQLFGSEATLYERQSATALAVQELATTENIVMIALSQKNEDSIKGGKTYNTGTKGGGDADAAADAVFIPRIDKDAPGIMEIELKHSRYTANTAGKHLFNPPSGLFYKSETIDMND
jgi:replicative DNA helicase